MKRSFNVWFIQLTFKIGSHHLQETEVHNFGKNFKKWEETESRIYFCQFKNAEFKYCPNFLIPASQTPHQLSQHDENLIKFKKLIDISIP